MKRHFHLFDSITDAANLLEAFGAASRGKRGKPNVAKFEANLLKEIFVLREELRSGTYRPGEYFTFHIREPKRRMISAAPFRDRVVHHAIVRVIEPIFEKTFVFDSYANRKGKGTHAGIRRFQAYSQRYRYVLQCDVQKYFPSIDHQILKDLLARKIGCRQTLALLYLIIDCSNAQELVSDFYPGDDLFAAAERRKGLPMGNLTSQFLANCYLNPLDHYVREVLRAGGYVRYVDDFALFGNDKAELHRMAEMIRAFLAQRFRLTLHWHKTTVGPTAAGSSFLGQQVYPGFRLIQSANVRRFWRRLREQDLPAYFSSVLPADRLDMRLNAWRGHIGQANTRRLQWRVFSYLIRAGVHIGNSPEGGWRVLG